MTADQGANAQDPSVVGGGLPELTVRPHRLVQGSYAGTGVLATAIGMWGANSGEGLAVLAGVLGVAVGALLVVLPFAAKVVISHCELRARNLLRRRRWPWTEVTAIETRSTSTPMTGAAGFGQLRVRSAAGTLGLFSTTTQNVSDLQEVVSALEAYSCTYGFTLDVREALFVASTDNTTLITGTGPTERDALEDVPARLSRLSVELAELREELNGIKRRKQDRRQTGS